MPIDVFEGRYLIRLYTDAQLRRGGRGRFQDVRPEVGLGKTPFTAGLDNGRSLLREAGAARGPVGRPESRSPAKPRRVPVDGFVPALPFRLRSPVGYLFRFRDSAPGGLCPNRFGAFFLFSESACLLRSLLSGDLNVPPVPGYRR